MILVLPPQSLEEDSDNHRIIQETGTGVCDTFVGLTLSLGVELVGLTFSGIVSGLDSLWYRVSGLDCLSLV